MKRIEIWGRFVVLKFKRISISSPLLILTFCLVLILTGTRVSAQECPFSEGITEQQMEWLMENGFNTETYGWNNPEVNQHLLDGVQDHRQGKTLTTVGACSAIVGGIFLGTGVYQVLSGHEQDATLFVEGGFFAVGGGVCIGVGTHRKINAEMHILSANRVLSN